MRKLNKFFILAIVGAILAGCSTNTASTNNISNSNSTTKILEDAPLADLELKDQFGKIHKLSDYKGKKIFLNFMSIYCKPCVMELPHIKELAEDSKDSDTVVFSVMVPADDSNPKKSPFDAETGKIINFLDKNEVNYPILFDEGAKLSTEYGIVSYPTTFTITPSGKVYGYVTGLLNKNQMNSILDQTVDNTETSK